MKILMITPYIYCKEFPKFKKNHTGFGLMVYDIANYIGKKEMVDLFAVNIISESVQFKNFKTIKNSWLNILKNYNFKSIINAFKFLKKYKLPLKENLRVIYQFLSLTQLSNTIKKYDLVHIHGCSPITEAASILCKHANVPYLITLHGLVSFEESVNLYPSLKQYEKDLLIKAYLNNIHISFISTGIREVATQYIKNTLAKS